MYLGFWVKDIDLLKLPTPNYVKRYETGYRCIWHIEDYEHTRKGGDSKTIKYLDDIVLYAVLAHKGNIIERFIPKQSDLSHYEYHSDKVYNLRDLDFVSKEFKMRINRAKRGIQKVAHTRAREQKLLIDPTSVIVEMCFYYCYAFARLNIICESNFFYIMRELYFQIHNKRAPRNLELQKHLVGILTKRANEYKTARNQKEADRMRTKRGKIKDEKENERLVVEIFG